MQPSQPNAVKSPRNVAPGSIATIRDADWNVSIEWKPLAESATSAEKTLIAALAAVPGTPIPKMGLELGDGIPFSFVWEVERVATAWGLDDDDRESLASLGWTAVEPEADAVMRALAIAGRN